MIDLLNIEKEKKIKEYQYSGFIPEEDDGSMEA